MKRRTFNANWIVQLMCVVWSVVSVHGKNCVKLTDCSCEFDDGSGVVDLSSLGSTDNTPRFYDYLSVYDTNYYSYNPCYPFTEVECTGAAVCKYDLSVFRYINVGAATKTSFSFDGANVIVTYLSQSGFDGESQVTLVCDPSATSPTLDAFGDIGGLAIFMLTLTSAEVCPVPKPPGSSDESGGLSGGSVLLIIVFVILVAYLAAGITFMKVKRNATGSEMIPNVTFWTSLPGLVKEGTLFVGSKVRGGSSPSGYAAT